VHAIGAALGDDVDVAAECTSELGLPSGRDDLELFHRVHAVRDAAQPRRIVVGGQAVDDEAVGEVALAADREARAGHRRCLREELRRVDVGRRHARHEEGEIQKVPPVHRHVLDFDLCHGTRDLAAGRFENRGLAHDRHARLESADGKHEWNVEGRAHRQRERTAAIGKSIEVHPDLVRSDFEVRKAEAAVGVGVGFRLHVRFRVSGGDVRAWHDGAERIGDASTDACVIDCFLCLCGARRCDGHARQTDQLAAPVH
jgi:hypothetical protein